MTTSSPTPATTADANAVSNPREEILTFPQDFPIKVMGADVDGFVHAVTTVAREFDPTFDASTIELRPSSGGKYLGVTVTVRATSREQLDNLYRALTSHPMVKVVL
ncbi:DUF493 domain-containing protein [Comamonas serinivorans]|uniref:UPF0250 protein CCO03_00655 n=1 Tax=Comamonas serinivorans TaxID=1082851 RepID=A0A1Y0EIV0_9BURK|nr:DUF493 family protein [Comamonas serinivorans]ARU03390.1 DUF493 domain-containing protein [Comamonas serinivorans]